MMITVSAHAMERYRERVADLPNVKIARQLMTPIVVTACRFGAHYVRLPSGHRLVLREWTIVTVLPADHAPRLLDRRLDAQRNRSHH